MMKLHQNVWVKRFAILGIMLVLTACNSSAESTSSPASTSTPTPTPTIVENILPSPTPSMCDGLGGNLEMQVLIGPSDAVGLEPVAIGTVPFIVIPAGDTYGIEGGGSITYHEVLEKKWGTYTVEFDMEAVVSGNCQPDDQNGVLNMFVETSGEQFVAVEAEGYQGEFPWSGSQEFNLSFPIEEGASVTGEGWAFVLHLNQ